EVHATVGNLNNRIGVPMTLFGLQAAHRWAVVEVGTNQPGEVAELGRVTAPDLAILTLIDFEHTEGLGDLDGIEKEEGAIFGALREGGVAIGYADDPRVQRQLALVEQCQRFTYGYGKEADCLICDHQMQEDGSGRVELEIRSGAFGGASPSAPGEGVSSRISLKTPLTGKPGALAVAAALSATFALLQELPSRQVLESCLVGAGEAGRVTPVQTELDVLLLDDSYNSNPASVELSLDSATSLAQVRSGRLFCVLGDMLELGQFAEDAHRAMGKSVASADPALFVGIGPFSVLAVEQASALRIPARHFPSTHRVAEFLLGELRPRDVVLIKASRGIRAEKVVQELARQLGTSKRETS
ncbi:MAG: UDP-N-acetylmuramoylalanyl-D-glutamyl-2, 6-diaminopimelate--D-alanyl-D-alanine ligase, partial [Polyangiaceae bacterium]|nr:UDP-N-acetylmuramoylalanyl-D-glutamyl-2, 6-diaminopimelate--D-alanyl-D-alanine ligase [Polyangiaceae bacterium]